LTLYTQFSSDTTVKTYMMMAVEAETCSTFFIPINTVGYFYLVVLLTAPIYLLEKETFNLALPK